MHSLTHHAILFGFGCYTFVSSAASIIISFNCSQSPCTWLSSITRSVSNFPYSPSSCSWNHLTMLAPHNPSTRSLPAVPFGSYLLYAILHLYLPLTELRSQSLLAPLHSFTSSMLLAFLSSASMWSV